MSKPEPKPKEAERAGPAVSRERASADYERPREDVSDLPDPVTLPANKARAGVPVKGMRLVLIFGIILTILGYLIGYYLFYT
jgi:hypothetical protein